MRSPPLDHAPAELPAATLLCLRIVLALQCLGVALHALRFFTPVSGVLLMRYGVADTTGRTLEQVAACLLVLAIPWLWRRNVWVLATVALWMAVVSAAAFLQDDDFGAQFVPVADAVRYVTPVLLLLAAVRPLTVRRASWIMGLARLAAAATFIGHGLEAMLHNPRFIDLLIGTADRRLGLPIDEGVARTMLTVIGAIDIALAGLIVVGRWRWVALHMTFWGLVTAMSRITAMDLGALHLTLVRAANAGVPLALYFWWRAARP